LRENDCSPFATCNNTWGSYTCTCLEGFVDINPKRPGRSCQGINQSSANQTMSMTTTPAMTRTTPMTTTSTASITVKCNMASITVTVAKDFLQSSHITEGALYLGMADCGVNGGNSTHAQLTVAWDECNTVLMHKSYITNLNIPVLFVSIFVNLIYRYDMIKDVISGSGIFQVTVQLMNGSVPLPHNYSLSPSEAVVLMVSLNTSVDKIKVVINKCWATPTPIPTVTFLDRCSVNPYTTVITNGNSSTSSLSVKIFSFVDLSIIYLHCQVEICVEIGPDSCAPVSRGTEANVSLLIQAASSVLVRLLVDTALYLSERREYNRYCVQFQPLMSLFTL
uniref:ZP domain-containing protein n=1 Tax=Periophthalmus magnuspinnatus TaxID=409849 RepID=A0A3B3ZFZ6_9GOBI